MGRSPRAVAAAALVALLAAFPAAADHVRVDAPPLPPAVAEQAKGLRPQGGGEMRFLGMSIYDGWYWGHSHEWSLTSPFALDLHYRRSLRGSMIAERSVSEIARLDVANRVQLEAWGEQLRRIFPDVSDGDRITGLFVPPGIVRYFFNGAPIGEVADPAFARAFFGIWLDPKTSRADFRTQLLGAR
jgi:hypothetical protein